MRRSPVLTVAAQLRRLWWRLWGPITVGVRGIVRDGDGRVLVVRHRYGRPTWHLPGGGVKRRERVTDAVVRELREEVGVEVTGGSGSLRLHGVYSNLREGKSDHIVVFIVPEWSRHESHSAEIDQSRWVDLAALPDDLSPGTRRRLDELQGGGWTHAEW